ncbi:hypothetical protein HPB48_020612 [Haemaphysalis longicornis]|uniref:Uncharacterized protein n=1 Tax=Haemaphysalis longicornis TaxID=44386 RepID=A0A9J6GHT9_HAELO|nr:hypothetical protein HPB48_020612 [Haemaphysalis longicornis]
MFLIIGDHSYEAPSIYCRLVIQRSPGHPCANPHGGGGDDLVVMTSHSGSVLTGEAKSPAPAQGSAVYAAETEVRKITLAEGETISAQEYEDERGSLPTHRLKFGRALVQLKQDTKRLADASVQERGLIVPPVTNLAYPRMASKSFVLKTA